MDLNGPDILDYSEFERSPWTESPMEATVFDRPAILLSGAVPDPDTTP
ncbi:MAG: hypothetical protein IJK79_06350 [Bacteroidales bacterium]|nr:hypothetical protein [Bacteroidales bacterium]